MTEIAIAINNVSKCFKRYANPADRLKELLLPGTVKAKEFWALRDVNLEIPKGKTIGIVGRNGSGKSTLLQIIAGTLTPTSGEVVVNGRVAALLELGSGFNPEFTGRQNVFFNGQLLGLTYQEIEARYDAIAAFADIGDFIDQPVKTYSSGMFVRLAFAVATSVDPDILVVDEALSVGDEAFQRKCYARIQAIKDRGGTILFVSHSPTSVVSLCDWAILMDRGELLLVSHPKMAISKYQELIYAPLAKAEYIRQEIRSLHQLNSQNTQVYMTNKLATKPSINQENREFYDPEMIPATTINYRSRGAKIIDPRITTLDGEVVNHLVNRRDYIYTYSVTFSKPAAKVRFGMLIKTPSGLEIGGASFSAESQSIEQIEAETLVVMEFRFKCLLQPGLYFLNAGVSGIVDGDFTYLARCLDVAMFRVRPEANCWGTGNVDFLIDPSIRITYDISNKEQEVELI
ncbi:ABC transporter ATP-binding protein [Microseira wollei]|uniref:ABC transporter related n=1 Tax=Microseira wollei NIES-4236 TaxID=2530354 RepID=A0AAV3XBQ4_9CYAN|nr:ABC transporter ATP-binding protein [Microseira wollei]GET37702.1 ABC transporter related [Microseira wollei NIES-4236]